MQSTIALSTCEAEITAVSFCGKALLGLRNLLYSLLPGAQFEIPRLFGDNEASNRIAACQASVRHMRHLALPQLWIRSQTREGLIRIFNKRSQANTADLLTKVLSQQVVDRLWSLMRVTAMLG